MCVRGDVITRVMIDVRGREKREKQRDGNVRKTRPAIAGLEDGSRPWTKESG